MASYSMVKKQFARLLLSKKISPGFTQGLLILQCNAIEVKPTYLLSCLIFAILALVSSISFASLK